MKVLKWIGIVLGGLIGLIVIALLVIMLISNSQINKTYDTPSISITVPDDAESIAEGQRLAVTRGCADCHGPTYQGGIFVDDPALGRIVAANLTSGEGGIGTTHSDEDIYRSMIYGVQPDGTGVLFMPAHEYYRAITDDEVALIIAFLRTVDPVDTDHPENKFGPLGHVLNVVAPDIPLFPADYIDDSMTRATVAAAPTAEYGAQLAAACTGCHGDGFSGGPIPGDPAAVDTPNITLHETGIAGWTQEDFATAIRTGVRPDGSVIDGSQMPWPNFSQFTDDEVTALWLYLQTVEPQPHGNR